MGNITSADVAGISESLRSGLSVNNSVESISNPVSGLKDPIGSVLFKTVNKINDMELAISNKIDKLYDDLKVAGQVTGVSLVDNKIVVTVANEQDSAAVFNKISSDISNINNLLTRLNTLTSSLNILNTTVSTLKKAMDVQEALLSINPVSKATLTIFKQAIKILFFKDVLGEYSNILSRNISNNQSVISNLSKKFHDLQVQVVTKNQADKGDNIDKSAAEQLISSNLLNQQTYDVENYMTETGVSYLLKIEKYGSKEIIARAYDSFSNQVITQTAPSFVSTSAELMTELKQILDIIK